MNSLLQKNLISTKEASALSGYNADYLSRLCREKKIASSQVGRTWLIERASLEVFMETQVDRKIELAENLARERELEYRKANSSGAHVSEVASDLENKMRVAARSMLGAFTAVRMPRSMPVMSGQAFAAGLTAVILGASVTLAGSGVVARAGEMLLASAFEVRALALETIFSSDPHAVAKTTEFSRIAKEEIKKVDTTLVRATDRRVTMIPVVLGEAIENSHEPVEMTAHAYARAEEIFETYPEPFTSAQMARAIVYAVTHPEEVLATIAREAMLSYNRLGVYARNDIETVLALHLRGVEAAGNRLLSVSVATRDGARRAPLAIGKVFVAASSATLSSYERAVYAYVENIEVIPSGITSMVYELGNGIGGSVAVGIESAPVVYEEGVRAFTEGSVVTGSIVSEGSFAFGKEAKRTVIGLLEAEDRAVVQSVEGARLAVRGLENGAANTALAIESIPSVTTDTVLGIVGGIALRIETADTSMLSASPLASLDIDRFIPGFLKNITAVLARAVGSAFHGIFGPLAGFFGATEQVGLAVIPNDEGTVMGPTGAVIAGEAVKGNTIIYGGPVTILRNEYPTVTYGGVPQTYVDERIDLLRRTLYNRIEDVSDERSFRGDIVNSTITDSSIVDSSFTGGSVTGSALSVATTTITGSLTVNGNLSVSGAVSGNSTTTNATSTNLYATNASFDNLLGTNATITNATTTNFYATASRLIAATIDTLTAPSAVITNLLATNATTTNATSTNLFATDFRATLATIVSGFFTNLIATNATTTNATSTNLFATNFVATNATSTNFFATTGRITTGIIDALTAPLATITTALITNLTASNAVLTNATTTNATTTGSLALTYATPSRLLSLGANGVASSTSLSTWVAGTSNQLTVTDNGIGGITLSLPSTIVIGSSQPTTIASNGATSTFGGGIRGSIIEATNYIAGPYILATSTTATSAFSGNIAVGRNATLGTTAADLLTVNSSIASNLIPSANNTYDLGSTGNFWRRGYVDELIVNNLSAASTSIAGTVSSSFSINTDNATNDTEDSSLIFNRGTATPNALLTWNSTTDRFEFNMPVFSANGIFTNATSTNFAATNFTLGGATFTSLLGNALTNVAGVLTVSTSSLATNFFQQGGNAFGALATLGTNDAQNLAFETAGLTRLTIDTTGNVGIGTTSPATKLDVWGSVRASGTGNAFVELYPTYGVGASFIDFKSYGSTAQDARISSGVGSVSNLIFSTGGATLTEAMRIMASGNVGIGTTNPGYRLEVGPTVSATTSIQDVALIGALSSGATNSTFGSRLLLQTENANGNPSSVGIAALNSASGSNLADLAFYAGAAAGYSPTEYMRILGNSGNVGIGATAVVGDEKLNVNGRIRAGTFQSFNLTGATFYGAEPGGTAASIQLHQAGIASVRMGSKPNDPNFYLTNDYDSNGLGSATTSITVSLAGNVGIGTITPGNKLHVKGDFRIEDSTDTTTRDMVLSVPTTGGLAFTDSVSGERMRIDWNGNVGIGTTTPVGLLTVNNSASAQADVYLTGTNNYGGRARFERYNTDSSYFNIATGNSNRDTLEIYPDGVTGLVMNTTGNVGIGTTSPTNTLSVTGTLAIDSGGETLKYFTGGSGLAYLGMTSNSALGLITNGGERIRITAAGNVGIGTTTPSSLLSVGGSALFAANAAPTLTVKGYSSGSADIFVDTATNYGGFGYKSAGVEQWYIGNNATGANDISFMLGASRTIAMFIRDDGNVGIGTTAPAVKLDVFASTSVAVARLTNNGTFGSWLGLKATGTGGREWIVQSTAGTAGEGQGKFVIADQNAAATRLVIDTSGNVGIGTAAPLGKLHVAGTALVGGEPTYRGDIIIDQFGSSETTTGGLEFKADNAGSGYGSRIKNVFNGTSAYDLRFQNRTNSATWTTMMTIAAAGNVGIGTTTPQKALSVNTSGDTIGVSIGESGSATGKTLDLGYYIAGDYGRIQAVHSGTAFKNLALNPSGGNVGIGNTDAPFRLTINSGSGAVFFRGRNNTATRYRTDFGIDSSGLAINAFDDTGGVFLPIDIAGSKTTFSAGNVGIGTTTPSARLAITQSANTSAGGLYLAETGNTDFRSLYMDTAGVLSFYGGDTAGTLNTATLAANGTWTNASDRAYKENITDLHYNLDTIRALQPRSYTYTGTTQPGFGFIAQELKEVLPEVVYGTDGKMSVDYGSLSALALQGIKELDLRTLSLAPAEENAEAKNLEVSANASIAGMLTVSGTGTFSDSLSAASVLSDGSVTGASFLTANVSALPEDVLTGGSADLFKMASYAITGMQALSERTDLLATKIDEIDARVALLESSTPATQISGAVGFSIATLKSALQTLGIYLENGVAQFETLVFRQLAVAKDTNGDSSAGSQSILAGNTVTQVENPYVLPTSKIFVTFTGPIQGAWYISNKEAGKFRVTLENGQSADVSFDYFILQTEGQLASPGAVAPVQQQTSVPTPAPSSDPLPPVFPDAGTGTTTPVVSSGDTTPPTITLIGPAAREIDQGAIWIDQGASASDETDGELTGSIQVQGTVNTATPGTYTVSYSVSDAAGNEGHVSRIVSVQPVSASAPAPEPTPTPAPEPAPVP